jgi:O-antigen ligase
MLLLLFASISLLWSGLDAENTKAMLFTILLAYAGLLVGYSVVACHSSAALHNFIWRLTVFLALVSVMYVCESFFNLGLRSEVDKLWTDFGIQRVKGPLFGASTGHFILIPALGFAIEALMKKTVNRVYGACVALALVTAILGLGSRGALAALATFICLVLLTTVGGRQRLKLLVLLVLVVGVSAGVIFSRASANRITATDDDYRRTTYQTGFTALADGGFLGSITGLGYGALWPWYMTDMSMTNLASPQYYHATPFGYTLYHPHSTVVFLVVELGVIGLLFCGQLVMTLGHILRRSVKRAQYQYFSCAVVASSVALLVDFFFLKNARLSALWWLFLFAALEFVGSNESRTGFRVRVPAGAPSCSWTEASASSVPPRREAGAGGVMNA